MPIQSFAGKAAPRRPDPVVPRVQPSGLQNISAYNALCLYYSPLEEVWRAEVQTIPNGGTRAVEFLLFGSDYPALVTATSYYGENLGGNGSYFPTFNESNPFYGSYGVSNLQYLLPATTTPIRYKEIANGVTPTNGVSVQGFPYLVNLRDHGIAFDDPPTLGAPCALGMSVLTNTPVVTSSTSYATGLFSPPEIADRLPVIIHEKDFTQAVVDANFEIPSATLALTFLGLSGYSGIFLDVVGIWASDYNPLD